MQELLLAPEITIAKPFPKERISIQAIRWPERVIYIFLIYAAAMAMVLPVAPGVTNLIVRLNVAVIVSYGLLVRFDFTHPRLVTSITRDWLPLAVIVLAYREMGWLALPHQSHALESHWIVWDRQILHGGAKAVVEAFGPILPSVLEIAYSLVYALAPFSLAVLYLYRRRDRVETFLLVFTLSVLLCYAQLPFWPSNRRASCSSDKISRRTIQSSVTSTYGCWAITESTPESSPARTWPEHFPPLSACGGRYRSTNG